MHGVRKKLIIGNWKSHLNVRESSTLLNRLENVLKVNRTVEVAVAPSFVSLQPLSLQINRRKLRLAAQNGNAKDESALTGEVSFSMLRGLVHYAIVGHSSRRLFYDDDLKTVREKMAACVRNGIVPVLCVGETKKERLAHETRQVLHDQITTALADLTAEEVSDIVIAYEPIWAISTFDGEVAKPDVIAKEIKYVRSQVADLHGKNIAEQIHVIYGGSVDDHDASYYLNIDGCDGALVGAASLNYHKFESIISAAAQAARRVGGE